MDFTLNDEQRAIRQVTAEFVDREITPHAAAWDRAEQVDLSIIKKLADLGILGITIPEEHGGSGGDHTTYCLVLEELGKGDSSVRGIVSVSLGLVAKSINGYGTAGQKAAWLPRLCAGDALGCFALTEPDTGSDAGALATRATKLSDAEGGGWRLDGSKMFITNGTWAQVALVFARTGGPGPKGVSAFLVPTATPGLRIEEIHGKLGLRGQATAALTFEGVTVGDDALLGGIGEGFRIAMSALAKGRMSLAAGCVGIIQGCLEAAVTYAKQREQFGRPIASFQLVQQLIADISVEADAARLLTWRVADLIDRGCPSPPSPPPPSSTPPRPRSARPTRRCRSSAVTATSMSTRWANTCATPGSLPCTRGRARSRSSSSVAPSPA